MAEVEIQEYKISRYRNMKPVGLIFIFRGFYLGVYNSYYNFFDSLFSWKY